MGTARTTAKATPRKTAKKAPKLTPRAAQLAGQENALRVLAKRLRTAADRVDLAATYAGDGAALTAEVITIGGRTDFARGQRSAVSLALEAVRALSRRTWLR